MMKIEFNSYIASKAKLAFVLLVMLWATGCAPKFIYPATTDQHKTAAIVNAYPDKLAMKRYAFLNKIRFEETTWNIKDLIGKLSKHQFSQLSNLSLKPLELSQSEQDKLDSAAPWPENKALMADVFSKAQQQGIQTLYVLRPGRHVVKLGDNHYNTQGTGPYYAYSTVNAASAIDIDVLDVNTQALLGTMQVSYMLWALPLEDDLSEAEKASFPQPETAENPARNAASKRMYLHGLSARCASIDRFDELSATNRQTLKKGVITAVGKALSQIKADFEGRKYNKSAAVKGAGSRYIENMKSCVVK